MRIVYLILSISLLFGCNHEDVKVNSREDSVYAKLVAMWKGPKGKYKARGKSNQAGIVTNQRGTISLGFDRYNRGHSFDAQPLEMKSLPTLKELEKDTEFAPYLYSCSKKRLLATLELMISDLEKKRAESDDERMQAKIDKRIPQLLKSFEYDLKYLYERDEKDYRYYPSAYDGLERIPADAKKYLDLLYPEYDWVIEEVRALNFQWLAKDCLRVMKSEFPNICISFSRIDKGVKIGRFGIMKIDCSSGKVSSLYLPQSIFAEFPKELLLRVDQTKGSIEDRLDLFAPVSVHGDLQRALYCYCKDDESMQLELEKIWTDDLKMRVLSLYEYSNENFLRYLPKGKPNEYGESEESGEQGFLFYEDNLVLKSKNTLIKMGSLIRTNAMDEDDVVVKPYLLRLRTPYLMVKYGIVTDEDVKSEKFSMIDYGVREDPFGDIIRELGYTEKKRDYPKRKGLGARVQLPRP